MAGARIGGEGVAPSQLVEGDIEGGTRLLGRGLSEAPLEQAALLAVHQRSSPRSRRRRAMMFRWISALPP